MDAAVETMYIEFGTMANAPEETYIMNLLPRFSGAGSLVVTQILLSIWSIVSNALDKGEPHEMTRKYGLLIEGPKGTGKTTSLLYLWKKLRDNTPVLLIGPSLGERCADYLRWFCKQYKIEHPTSNDANGIFSHILQSLKAPKKVLLIDLIAPGSTEGQTEDLLLNARIARTFKWYVVISESSGSGWRLDSKIRDTLGCLYPVTEQAVTKNFTEQEAMVYMEKNGVDVTKLETLCEVTAWNPLLLHEFDNTLNNPEAFGKGLSRVYRRMLDFVSSLIKALDNRVFFRAMVRYYTFLVYAANSISIPTGDVDAYKTSYIAREQITYDYQRRGEVYIGLYFPRVYKYLMEMLCDNLEEYSSDEAIRAMPAFQGLLFEKRVCEHLHQLNVHAINQEHQVKRWCFVIVNSISSKDAVSALSLNILHHQRPGHPAIDAVCLVESSTKSQCLLLIQISLSKYSQHPSKACDIRKPVTADEKLQNPSASSIVDYYNKLAQSCDNVIYVYVSPRQYYSSKENLQTTFVDVLPARTRSKSARSQNFWYALVDPNSPTTRTLETDLEIVTGYSTRRR